MGKEGNTRVRLAEEKRLRELADNRSAQEYMPPEVLGSNHPDAPYTGPCHAINYFQASFIEFAKAMRELGAVHVVDGTMSATFPAPAKPDEG